MQTVVVGSVFFFFFPDREHKFVGGDDSVY